jgi:hypothetical protein
MDSALKTYLEKCRAIFNAHRLKLSKVVPLPGKKEPTKDDRMLFESAIKEAEDTEEFKAFAKVLGAGPLASDLERLARKEERQREKPKSKHRVKSIDDCKIRQGMQQRAFSETPAPMSSYGRDWICRNPICSVLWTIIKTNPNSSAFSSSTALSPTIRENSSITSPFL